MKPVSKLHVLAALCFFGLAATAQEAPHPGYWVPTSSFEDVELGYLQVEQLNDVRVFDDVPHVLVSESLHASRVAALRNWMTRDALSAKQFEDPLPPDDGPHWYLQLSAAGYALEGHALAIVFRLDGTDITEARAFGFWTETPVDGVSASVGPQELIPVADAPWREVLSDGTVRLPDPEDYADTMSADLGALERYRSELKRFWGELPETGATEILLNPRSLKRTTRIEPALATDLLTTFESQWTANTDLDERLAGLDFTSMQGDGIDVYKGIWTPLISEVCERVKTLECEDVSAEQSVYPQTRIEWGVNVGPLGGYTDALKPWEIRDDSAERRLVSALDEDTVSKKDNNGNVTVDFALGREIWIDGRRQMPGRYIGPLENGRAEGNGTLYFGRPGEGRDWDNPGVPFATARFSNGQLDGPASFFFKDGTLDRRGIFENGARNGVFDHFRTNGTPFFRAHFQGQNFVDGPFLKTELNTWTLKPWRIFEGKIEGGEETGEWHYLPVIQTFANGDRLVVVGFQASYLFSNGDVLSGEWNDRYQRFHGTCSLVLPSGRLEATCDGLSNAEYPFDGPGRFLPSKTNVDQEWQDVHVINGAFEFYRIERVRTKKAGWLRRFGDEVGRWIDDTGQFIEDAICGVVEGMVDNCTVNIAVHVAADGDVTIGDFSGDKPDQRLSSVVSEETIRWFVDSQPLDFEILMPLEFDSEPYFDIPKLGAVMPEKLATPAFPKGHVAPPTSMGLIRPTTNTSGSGAFGVRRSRKGGVYHTGFDYWTGVGDNIFSPVTGTVLYTKVNPDGLNTIVIESSKVVVRILYVGETVPNGTKVKQGDWIATAGNLANRYPGVPNHVHMTILKPDSEWAYSMDGTTRIFRDWPYPVDFRL